MFDSAQLDNSAQGGELFTTPMDNQREMLIHVCRVNANARRTIGASANLRLNLRPRRVAFRESEFNLKLTRTNSSCARARRENR